MAYRRPKWWRDYLARDFRAKVTGALGPEFQAGGKYYCLPEFYKKQHLDRITYEETPVHWRPSAEKFHINEDGVVEHVENIPIPVIYPLESNQGLWGGEGVIKGYIRRQYRKRVWEQPGIWWPKLRREVFYSEILDKNMLITCTKRTLDLVDQHYGFDNYILDTHEVDLKSKLGMRLKQSMLTALATGKFPGIHGDYGAVKKLIERYEKHIIPLEQVEWLGLSPDEALEKWKRLQIEEVEKSTRPLKEFYRERLIASLQSQSLSGDDSSDDKPEDKSWLSGLNPFSRKSSTSVT